MRLLKCKNFISDYLNFKKLNINPKFQLRWKDRYPCLDDKTEQTSFDRHYIYHTAWATRILSKTKPKKHVDISSSLYFSSIVSAFVPIDFYDYRPPQLKLSNLTVSKANLLSLPFKDNSLSSLSCMHTVEHIGLGRYGDAIDPDGDIKAIQELVRVLKGDGSLLFVVPIGARPLLKFNAHRIYTVDMIKEYFSDLKLEEFAMIPENEKDGGLVVNPKDSLIKKQKYACGCFWFTK